MKTSSKKAKGRAFQKWVGRKIANLLGLKFGKDELVASRPMGQGGPDIVLKGEAFERFPYCVESKWQESWDIPGWVRQAKDILEREREEGREFRTWFLFVRKSQKGPKALRIPPLVIMEAEVFFDLVREGFVHVEKGD